MTTLEKIRTDLMKEYNDNANSMDWSYRAGLAKALDIIKEHAEDSEQEQLALQYKEGYLDGFKCAKDTYQKGMRCPECGAYFGFNVEPQESEDKECLN